MNKDLIKQVQAGTHCIWFVAGKDKLSDLHLVMGLIYTARLITGHHQYYWRTEARKWLGSNTLPTGLTPIPLDDFFKEEESELEQQDIAVQWWYKKDYETIDFFISKYYPTATERLTDEMILNIYRKEQALQSATPSQPTLPETYTREQMIQIAVAGIHARGFESPAMSTDYILEKHIYPYLNTINNGK